MVLFVFVHNRNLHLTDFKDPLPIGVLQYAESNHPKSGVTKYICSADVGRLGNLLFEFASSFGIAYSKGMKAVVLMKSVVNTIFELKNNQWLAILKDKSVCKGAKVRQETINSAFDAKLVNFTPDASYRIINYLQSWRYFNSSIPELKKQLVFRANIQRKVEQNVKKILSAFKIKSKSEVTLIGVHIRRGDMTGDHYIKVGYQVASVQYIQRAVQYFSNIPNRLFVVCTNDLKWAQKNMPKTERVFYAKGNAAEVDLALLAGCDHLISTVGSFSWWAGFFNGGTVLYYKWPARDGTKRRQGFSKDYMDFFMPHWIGL